MYTKQNKAMIASLISFSSLILGFALPLTATAGSIRQIPVTVSLGERNSGYAFGTIRETLARPGTQIGCDVTLRQNEYDPDQSQVIVSCSARDSAGKLLSCTAKSVELREPEWGYGDPPPPHAGYVFDYPYNDFRVLYNHNPGHLTSIQVI